MPGQRRVARSVEQQPERGFSNGPGRSGGTTAQITAFGQVMLDQARLVRIQCATDLATHPAPAFKVRLLVQGSTHDPGSYDNETQNNPEKPKMNFPMLQFFG
jgi:hypothetical protein